MSQNRHWEQDKDATVYVGNIDERVTPAMVYEIMLQMGPIHNLHMPRDRVTQNHQGFGFVEFRTPADADYAANVMNGIKLYGKSIRVNKASADKSRTAEVGAELYIGNLDVMVDEKLLYDTFSRFGPLINLPKVARDENGNSKGYGFVSYGDFESSDAAMETMNGQYILSKQVVVQYAFKKDGKNERHGDEAERALAAQAKKHNIVPESQLPAILQGGAPLTGANATPTSTTPRTASQIPISMPASYDMGAPPSLPMGNPMGAPSYGAPVASRTNGYAPRVAPPLQGLGMPGALPPAPSGLPARPPTGQPGFNNPAVYHPGFRGAPGAAPSPGFVPPPGFAAPPQGFPHHPPPGFQRR